jgi:hypothetical protein
MMKKIIRFLFWSLVVFAIGCAIVFLLGNFGRTAIGEPPQ